LIIIFFAVIPLAFSLFHHREENELFLSLPVSRPFLTAARFTVLFLMILPLHVVISLPAFAAYLAYTAAGARLFLGIVEFCLLAPVFPLTLALALTLGIRRLRHPERWNAAVETASIVLVFSLLVFFQLVLQRALIGIKNNETIYLIQLADFLAGLMRSFPPASWAAATFLQQSGVSSLLFSFLLTAALFVPVFIFACREARTSDEIRVRRAEGKPAGLRPAWIFPGVLPQLVYREWKLLISQSGTVFETIVRLLALPALLLIYGIAGPREYTDILIAFATSSPAATIAVIGILFLLLDISFLAATALSREGESFALSLSLPLGGAQAVKAKLIFLLLLALLPAALLLVVIYLFLGFPAETLVYSVPGIISFLIFSFCVSIYFDLRRPAFSRMRPVQAVRWNANTVTAFALQATSLAGFGFIAWLLSAAGMNPFAVAIFVVEIIAAIDLIVFPRLLSYAGRRYEYELEA
jgi:ABC-2 type transport system permease protein